MDEEAALRRRLAEYHEEAGKVDGLSAAAVAAAERALLPQIDEAAAKVRRLATPPALAELADIDVAENWVHLTVHTRREVVRTLAAVRLAPGTKGDGPRFNPLRLANSRWVGEDRTWGEMWASLMPDA